MALRITRALGALFLCLGLILALDLRGALAKDKASVALSHYIMGVFYEDLGNVDKAIEEYKQALKADEGASIIHLNLASTYIKKNNLLKAVEESEAAVRLDPESVEPHAILALLYTTQNKPEAAAKEYEVALKNASALHPKNIDIYKSLGAIYIEQRKYLEAEGMFKLAVGLAPDDAESHFYLASIYNELKDSRLAEKEANKAIELKPDYHQALNFLGYLWVDQNRNLDKGGALIQRALALEPVNGAYVDSLGWYYFRKGKLKEALVELEKAIALYENPEIYQHLGDVYSKSGDLTKANLNWQKSKELGKNQ